MREYAAHAAPPAAETHGARAGTSRCTMFYTPCRAMILHEVQVCVRARVMLARDYDAEQL